MMTLSWNRRLWTMVPGFIFTKESARLFLMSPTHAGIQESLLSRPVHASACSWKETLYMRQTQKENELTKAQ